MVPDRQKGWTDGRTDGRTEWTDAAKTISLRLQQGIKISVFRVMDLKILGRVGTYIFFFSGKKYDFMHFERHFAFQNA